MLSRVLRTYFNPDESDRVTTISFPQVMYYGPGVSNKDLGARELHGMHPFVILHGHHGCMIQALGVTERAAINEEYEEMLAGLGGSLREKSYSRAALREALRIDQAEGGAATELLDVREFNLPMFVPDLPIEGYPSSQQASITQLVETCRRADAMIWSSPTYHGTVSGVVKNALDFIELLADNQPPYLQGHAVGIMTLPDPTALIAMMNTVHELRAWLAPTQVTLSRQDFTAELILLSFA